MHHRLSTLPWLATLRVKILPLHLSTTPFQTADKAIQTGRSRQGVSVAGVGTFSRRYKHFFRFQRDIFPISFFRAPAYISGERRRNRMKEDKTMTRYHGNDTVKPGFYWNPARWEITTIAGKGGALPGNEEVNYHRVAMPLILLLGPTMGAAYVIFLPLIGFALFFGFLGKKALPHLHRAALYLATRLAPGANQEQ
jgi:hypothetical protein